MKLKLRDNKIYLPFDKRDKFYKIFYDYGRVTSEIRYDKVTGNPIEFGKEKIVGYRIVECGFSFYWELVQAIEMGFIGTRYFLSEEEAEKEAREKMRS